MSKENPKVLFLDDDPARHRRAALRFVNHCTYHSATTAEQAIAILDAESPFDLVMLDHDLGGTQYAPSDEKSGYQVAKHIAAMPAEKLPTQVIVHSFNPVGAQNMVNVLFGVVPGAHVPFNL